jgi:hypothetical protein
MFENLGNILAHVCRFRCNANEKQFGANEMRNNKKVSRLLLVEISASAILQL